VAATPPTGTPPCPAALAQFVPYGTAMTGLTIDARVSVQLSVVTTLTSGQTDTETTSLDAQHAQAVGMLASINAANIRSMRITATDGSNGADGTCLAQLILLRQLEPNGIETETETDS
jgi:hypothetical protein